MTDPIARLRELGLLPGPPRGDDANPEVDRDLALDEERRRFEHGSRVKPEPAGIEGLAITSAGREALADLERRVSHLEDTLRRIGYVINEAP